MGLVVGAAVPGVVAEVVVVGEGLDDVVSVVVVVVTVSFANFFFPPPAAAPMMTRTRNAMISQNHHAL